MAIALKNYQQRTLDTLSTYLADARVRGAVLAYDDLDKEGLRQVRRYQPITELERMPYVCLRVPTGGGKTLLSMHSIKVASDQYLETEFPLVLLLVPSNAIRSQTLATLRDPNNANYQALSDAYDGKFMVVDIADFTLIRPSDLKSKAVVVVGTIQTLRVEVTEGRKIYDHHEDLEPHFAGYTGSVDGLELQENSNKPKFSFANLLNIRRPLVLMDESHNASTDLSFKVYRRINPACVIEYTATPKDNSNIIVHISASELKAEEMIKLPIVLNERPTWEQAVADAVRMRQKLDDIAQNDASYIRPIVLFQAENQGQAVTYQVLRDHLISSGIAVERIAVVTGDQRELDGINLMDKSCKIEFVITVQALKEGWDCSFAYVFCSLANTQSATAIEQLLGRVLRMPYAKRRQQEELNRAYAFVSSTSWKNSVSFLHDSLVKMGFEQQEVVEIIETRGFDFDDDKPRLMYRPPEPLRFELNSPAAPPLTPEEQAVVEIRNEGEKTILLVKGEVSDELQKKVVSSLRGSDKAGFQNIAKIFNIEAVRQRSPSERREAFRVPQLCIRMDDMLEVVDRELCMMQGWDLLAYPVEAPDLDIAPEGKQYEVDIIDGKLAERLSRFLSQMHLDLVDVGQTEEGIARWLTLRVRPSDLTYPVILEYCRRFVGYLLNERRLALSAIDQARFIIAKYLAERIKLYRQQAAKQGFQKTLFENQENVETTLDSDFFFGLHPYGPRTFYDGSFKLDKHYFPVIGDLKPSGEEFECAKVISTHPKVKYWIRNLERSPGAFSLPTSTDRFYPDFIAMLEDGRQLVIEYKGHNLASNDDSKEKERMGLFWEKQSRDKTALFLMASIAPGLPSLREQIDAKIGDNFNAGRSTN